MDDFEDLDGDDTALALLDITATVNMELTRPALLLGQCVGVAFCDLPEDTAAFTREHLDCRVFAAVALKDNLDLWYDEEYDDSGKPTNPARRPPHPRIR
ncbi:hypothetical protein LO763_22670 [Glycomyces sp. A-F 0318]|uniref:hypothetical protein n=1 Tax=Glycomyces amatae TaxID=2881355 RepID=UPI001E37296A|nr:hypothetical protein [Glycomyces amatae]MCD0446424.1 hypothetical protein [Glycomyces amatae]